MPKLFISYSHDSDQHTTKVLKFANLLRSHGYDVLIDQMDNAPEEGWPLWMNNGIYEAELGEHVPMDALPDPGDKH